LLSGKEFSKYLAASTVKAEVSNLRGRISLKSTEDPVKSMERLQGIYAISSKFWKFPVNIRAVVARAACKDGWLRGPSAVVALPAACFVNTGPYRGNTL